MSVSSMMAEKRLRKYRKQLNDSGWDLRAQERGLAENIDNLEGPVFYLCDYESGQLHVVATRKNVFDLVEQHKIEKGVSFQDICDALGSFYTDICDGKIKLTAEASNTLALAVSSYISGTQGYQLVNAQGATNMHYLVIRHWDYSTNTSMLRPVPIRGQTYYPPETIEGLVDQVMTMDKQNHPERFKSAQIIPFKIKQRTEV
ncbi:MAG: hypothetical protein N0E56_15800 [Candidatus Thiodiazotropha endolucinida]|nr:hypothetical protein [Candidatus Thiodiazotropha taylori]MCW4268087.1 hypothetical protein [Candidatus Thiodiazotropha endolucinida]